MLPRLRTQRTVTRLAEPSDALKILEFFRHSGKRYDPPLPDSLLTLEHWQMQTVELLKEYASGSGCRLFVFSEDEANVIGTVGLSRITRGVRFDCSLSYAISAAFEGQGMMSEAVRATIQYAFGELGLHRIEAAHATDNARSGALLKHLGFQVVGCIPDFLYTGGHWRATILYTLLNPSWAPPSPTRSI